MTRACGCTACRFALLPGLRQPRLQATHGIVEGQAVGGEDQVRDLGIQGVAHRRELGQRFAAIALRQQGARGIALQPRQLLLEADLDVHDEGARAQAFARRRGQHRAAAGGDGETSALEELRQQALFARAETRLALVLEDRRDVGAGLLLEATVGVGKLQLQRFGHASTERALARAHACRARPRPRA